MDVAGSKKRKHRDANGVKVKSAKKTAVDVPQKAKKLKRAEPEAVPEPRAEPEIDAEDDHEEEDNEDDVEDVEVDGEEAEQADEDMEDEDDDGDELSGNKADVDTDLPDGGNLTLPPVAGSEALSFKELNMSDKTMKAIDEMGFTTMTEIQRRGTSPSLAGVTFWAPRRLGLERRWHS
ncbi:hypothetical protein G7046_g6846 [Stylonectria norvegica]|nr:hypothetical protein G7046_g6846 [Stylonectria norvegica]